jgi:ubiquinone/menaquinone biosynthesis C-methylase UbiE
MSRAPDFVVQIIKDYWQPGQKILEIGCGPSFLRDDFGKDYIGVDYTDEPYTSDLPRDVDIICTAENLLVESNSIDIVVIKSAFYLFGDQKKSLEEVRRVLKPEGKVIIFDYNRKTQKNLQRKFGESYPCWTQWGLRKFLKNYHFKDVRNLIAATEQPSKMTQFYHFLRQELIGTWAIVCGTKEK